MHSYAERCTCAPPNWIRLDVCVNEHYVSIRISTAKTIQGGFGVRRSQKSVGDKMIHYVARDSMHYIFLDKISISIQFTWPTWRPHAWNFIAWRFVKNFARNRLCNVLAHYCLGFFSKWISFENIITSWTIKLNFQRNVGTGVVCIVGNYSVSAFECIRKAFISLFLVFLPSVCCVLVFIEWHICVRNLSVSFQMY